MLNLKSRSYNILYKIMFFFFKEGNIIDKYNIKKKKRNEEKCLNMAVLNWLALHINCHCEGIWLQRRIVLMKKCCSEAAF